MKHKRFIVFGVLVALAIGLSAFAADDMVPKSKVGASQSTRGATGVSLPGEGARMPGMTQNVPTELLGLQGRPSAPRIDDVPLDTEPEVWVDASWTGQGDVDDFNPALIWNTNAFDKIQEGIDAVGGNGIVNVFPGTYLETATGRYVMAPSGQGPHQFGLFIDWFHNGMMLRGVDASGTPITSLAGVAALVQLHATNDFGCSGLFLEADDVTITGLNFEQVVCWNKTIEVIGDNLTFKWNKITDGMSLYINDWRFDVGLNTSYVQSYHIEGNLFDYGTSVDLASGAGFSGPVSGRQIINNTFDMDWPGEDDYWAAISFTGANSGVPWFVQEVGAAVIDGNTFTNGEGFYIRHRGDFTDPTDFDWESYWNGNTFDKKVMFGTNPPTVQGTYSYGGTVSYPPYFSYQFNGCKEIGANIQREIDWATSGHTVLCGPGTYYEHDITVDKSLTITGDPGDVQPGPGPNAPIVDGQDLHSDGFLLANGVSNVTIQGFEIRNYAYTGTWPPVSGCPECGVGNAIQAWVASTDHITVADNYMHDLWWNGVLVGNDDATGDHTYWTVARNVLEDYGPPEFYNDGYGLELTNTSHAVIEDNDINAGTRYPGIGILVTMRRLAGEDIVIQRNKVRGAFDNAGIYVAAFGYDVPSNTLDDVLVQNNDVDITGPASRAANIASAYTGTLTNATVFDNSLIKSGGYGLNNLSSPTVNASGNWWGSTLEGAVDAAANGDIDFTPYLGNGTDTESGTLGFQGDFSNLHITTLGAQTGLLSRLQEAIDMAVGSDIYLAAGTYAGQTVILNHVGTLNIWGSGKVNTFLTAVASMPHLIPTTTRRPILSIEGSATVNLHDLTVDGDGLGNTNDGFVGISYWNSGGSVNDVDVLDIRDTPFSGAQYGVGVYVSKAAADPVRTVNLNDMSITGFQKNGAAFNGAGITVNCDNVTVIGAGTTGVTAQNGFQYSGSSGDVTNCTLSNIAYSGAGWASSTMLLDNSSVDIDNTDLLNCHYAIYAYDGNGSFTNGTITATPAFTTESPWGVLCYSVTALARANHVPPSPVLDDLGEGSRNNSLDANETFVVNNAEIVGNGSLYSAGVVGYITSGDLDFTLTNSTVRNWYYGIDLSAVGGTIVNAEVTDNAFMNLTNTYDNTAGHNWNNNCYSDLLSNAGYPDYNVGGGLNVDLNPNPNPEDCEAGAYVLTSDHIGCELACIGDTLYLTFDQTGYVAAQIFVQLPALLDANWAPGTAYNSTFPGSNIATNLSTSAGRRSGVNQIEVNVSWEPPYSDGDGSKYIACIPIKNNGATGGETLTISTGATTFYYNDGITTSFDLGSISLYVDCMDPVASIAYTVAPTCNGHRTAASIENLFTIGVLRGTTPPNAQLASAYVEVDGNPMQQISLFNALLPGDYSNTTFPSTAEALTIWGWLTTEGCHSLVVHAFDAECNEGTATINLTKDTDAPDLTITNTSSFCYNNEPTSPQFGGAYLDDYLDITTVLNSNSLLPGCYAQSGTMEISYLAGPPYTAIPLDVTGYPTAGDVLALWNWIVTQVPGADGENYTFDVEVCDCAGNCYSSTFTICIDLMAPANTFTLFNARPTDLGVWLQWSWTYVAGQAVKAEIWRSPDSGEYPEYAVDMWTALNNGTYYPTSYPPAGFTLVATQVGTTTSGAFAGLNGKGNNIHGGPGSAYWQDEDASWVDESEDRDIYRYVTFIQDAGGNWSSVGVGGYSLNANADRATNYWLGDYSRETTMSPHTSDGAVTFHDRSLLSSVYFTSTVAGGGSSPNFYDIGLENAENGVGKGEPNPDGLINFSDLVPFSFNFGIVGPNTFSVPSPPPVAFSNLDELPSLSAVVSTDKIESSDAPVYIDVALAGNGLDALKVFEAQLGYDSRVLEFVGVTVGDLTVLNGEAWTHSHCAENIDAVVIAGAALGESAVISGDQPIARAEFRWISETVGNTNVTLGHIRLADASGVEMPGPDVTLTLNNTSVLPLSYSLSQNFPNPFNPATTIRFTLPEAKVVKLSVYNVLGQSVRTLVNQSMEAGVHEVLWDGRDNSGQSAVSGVYIYRIQAGDFTSSHKMMLTR